MMNVFVSYKALMQAEMPRMKRVAAISVAALTFLLGLRSGTLFPNAASLLFLTVAAALLSALIFMFRSSAVYLAPILTFVSVIILTGSLQSAFFSISYVPMSVVLSVSFFNRLSKSRAIFRASVALGTFLLVSYLTARLLKIDLLPSASEFRTAIENFLSSAAINTKNGRTPLFSQESAAGIADYALLSIPAIFITAVNIVSYVSSSALVLLCRMFFFSSFIPGRKWNYMPSPATALTFIFSYFLSSLLIPFAKADVIGFAAENMLLALTPAMMIAGEKTAFFFALKHDKRILFVILTLFTVMFSASLYLMAVSFLGAIHVIYRPMKPYISSLFRRNDGDGNDGDNDEDE